MPEAVRSHDSEARLDEAFRAGGSEFVAPDSAARWSRLESGVVVAILTAALLLRLAYALHYRVNSDEPQHLHIAWAWAQGLIQYRDVFDNHAPLFHLLCAPLVSVLGERPDILIPMRLAMFPLYATSLAAVYAIAAALYSKRVAAWATVLAAWAPGFFLISLEFRADQLWAAFWLAAVAVLVSGQLTRTRGFVVGLMLGATLAVSLKTTLLLASLGIGSFASLALTGEPVRFKWRGYGAYVAAALFGFLVVPAAMVAVFAWQGALGPLFYGTISHNALPGLGLWHTAPCRVLLLPASVLPLWTGASLLARGAPTPGLAARRVLVLVGTGAFFVLLLGAWPLVTCEDFIPVSPLVALLITPVVLSLPTQLARVSRSAAACLRVSIAAPLLVVALEAALVLHAASPWVDLMQWQTALVASVLQITGPDDYVMDLKGETVFRRRPYYYVLENITKTRLERGLLPDSIPEDLVATRTPVVLGDRPGFPSRGRTFMAENYLPVGEQLRVLGRLLAQEDVSSPVIGFEVVVPVRYTIVAEHGTVRGWLDGVPYDGARFLAPGRHEFRPEPSGSRFAVLWAQAAAHGLSPFYGEGASS
jgi:hypothetical protein